MKKNQNICFTHNDTDSILFWVMREGGNQYNIKYTVHCHMSKMGTETELR